jgi:hypothetical protein
MQSYYALYILLKLKVLQVVILSFMFFPKSLLSAVYGAERKADEIL